MAVENRGGSEQSLPRPSSPLVRAGAHLPAPSPGILQGAAQMDPALVPGDALPRFPRASESPLFRGPKTQVPWSSWTAADEGTGRGKS